MKFDVVIGNPPYQNSDSNAESNKLWYKFIELGYQLTNQYVAMVTPDAWAHPVSSRAKYKKLFRDNWLVFVNWHECRRHFEGVGSAFTWWILSKETPKITRLRTDLQDYEISMSTWLWIPNDLSTHALSSLKQTLWSDRPKIDYVGSQLPADYDSKGPNDDFKYPFQLSTSTVSYRRDRCQYHDSPKIMFPYLASTTMPILDSGTCGATHGVNIVFDTVSEAEAAYEYYVSDEIQTALQASKWHHGNMNPQVLKQLPKLAI